MIMLVYDCGNKASFQSLDKWLDIVKDKCKENAKMLVIAKKCDIDPSFRKVNEDMIKEFKRTNHLEIFETSAKENKGI